MNREKTVEILFNCVNVCIILLIAALYLFTGTGVGDDAIAALMNQRNATVYRGSAEGKVALECAVSWDAAALPDILDTLAEYGAQATFFVSGDWANSNAPLLERMRTEGHEVGTMGYYPTFDGDVQAMTSDIMTSAAVIETITGAPAELYFSGVRSDTIALEAATNAGLTHVACTTDLLSGRGDAVDIATRALEHVFDGSILLMQPTTAASEALPTILSEIRARGLSVTAVGNVLQ